MSPADILADLGGHRAVAAALGIPVSTVYYWPRRGSIPQSHWPGLLGLASDLGVALTANDLFAAHQAARDEAVTGDAA